MFTMADNMYFHFYLFLKNIAAKTLAVNIHKNWKLFIPGISISPFPKSYTQLKCVIAGWGWVSCFYMIFVVLGYCLKTGFAFQFFGYSSFGELPDWWTKAKFQLKPCIIKQSALIPACLSCRSVSVRGWARSLISSSVILRTGRLSVKPLHSVKTNFQM